MKRFLPLLLTVSLASIAFASEDPVPVGTSAATPTPIPDPAPVVDPAASELLGKSAAAYGALTSLSLHVESSKLDVDKTIKTSGDLSFTRPGMARVEIVRTAGVARFVANDNKLWVERPGKPSTFESSDVKPEEAIEKATENLNSPSGIPLALVLKGSNFLSLKYRFKTVTSLSSNSVKIETWPNGNHSATSFTFVLTFDPADNLLRKVDVTVVSWGKIRTTSAVFSDVKVNAEIPDVTFVYSPGPGMKAYIAPPFYDPRLVVGARPFPLTGKDLTGKTKKWKKYCGQVVLIDFWATWCKPCMEELPNVLANYDKYHAQGFDVIGVSLDEDKEALVDMIQERNMKYRNLFDEKTTRSNPDAKRYGVQYIPFTLLIGKDGKIAAVNESGDKLEKNIIAALAKK